MNCLRDQLMIAQADSACKITYRNDLLLIPSVLLTASEATANLSQYRLTLVADNQIFYPLSQCQLEPSRFLDLHE